MISRDFILLALLGIVVILAAITTVTQVMDNTSEDVNSRSDSLGEDVGCVFNSENPEECRDDISNRGGVRKWQIKAWL